MNKVEEEKKNAIKYSDRSYLSIYMCKPTQSHMHTRICEYLGHKIINTFLFT